MITWSWVTWLSGWGTLNLNHKVLARATELNNKDMYVLEIGSTLFYYKLVQTLLQIGAASLLQIRTSAVTSWDS